MLPNIMTTDEACKVLKMGKNKLLELMKNDPTFPAIQEGRRCKWYIISDRLMDWADRRLYEKENANFKKTNVED